MLSAIWRMILLSLSMYLTQSNSEISNTDIVMDATERKEVREIISGVLSGWHSDTVLRETNTEKALTNIDNHLGKLNHSIIKHAKELEDLRLADVNHIIKCPVAPQVKEIDKKVSNIITANKTIARIAIKTKGNITLLLMAFGILVSIIVGFVGIFKTDKVQTITTNSDGKIDNINTAVKDPRTGKVYMWPSGLLIDSLSKADSIKYIN